MADFKGKFTSSRQDWETPQKLFDLVQERYGLNFDVAASGENTKCEKFFSIEDNALDQRWEGRCWLNPPYGGNGFNKLGRWVKKAFEESRKLDCTVTMLIPARTNTNWWHDYCMEADEILFIQGRPKFGGAKHGLPQPLAVIHFDGEAYGGLECHSLDLR